jgi:hypothetical protein
MKMQYTYNVERTVCTAENIKQSPSATSNTFHNIVVKQNTYGSKNRRRRPEPTPSSLLSPSYNIPYLSRAVMAVSKLLLKRVRHKVKNKIENEARHTVRTSFVLT